MIRLILVLTAAIAGISLATRNGPVAAPIDMITVTPLPKIQTAAEPTGS